MMLPASRKPLFFIFALAALLFSVAPVHAAWIFEYPDPLNQTNFGYGTSLAFSDTSPYPHIAYQSGVGEYIKYAARFGPADNNGTWTTEDLYWGIDRLAGSYPTIQANYSHPDIPAIAFMNQMTSPWSVGFADKTSGTWTVYTNPGLDPREESTGYYAGSATDMFGNMIVSYANGSSRGMHVGIREASGASSYFSFDPNGPLQDTNHQGTSVAIRKDMPNQWYFAYFNTSGLVCAWYNNAGIEKIWLVDDIGNITANGCSIALDPASHPHISYAGYDDVGNIGLKYASFDGSKWTTQLVDGGPVMQWHSEGGYSSLAFDGNGYPHISHNDASNWQYRHAWQDAAGWHAENVAGTGDWRFSWTSIGFSKNPANPYVHMTFFNESGTLVYATKLPDPPVVAFDGTPTSGSAPLTVGFTDRSSGDRTAWNWTFGDASPNSTEIHPTHTYTSVGTYSVTLTVANSLSSNTTTRTNYITVSPPGPAPTISSITPASSLKNTTIAFSIAGNNFQPGSVVNFTNTTYGNVTWNPGTITKTKITGSVLFPSSVPSGKWDVVVTVPDGRNATKKGGFEVKPWDKPKISSVTPTSGYRNSTTPFSLSGSNFQAGAIVNFSHASFGNVTAVLSSVTSTKITGNITFPKPAIEEKWDISVTTPDGGHSDPKQGAFTLKSWPQPTVGALIPTKGLVNTTFNFTITGNYFEPGSQVRFEIPYTITVQATTTSVALTKIQGYVTFPATAPSGKWWVVVLPPDADTRGKEALTMYLWAPPKVSSVTPTSGLRNTTVPFSLTGSDFQQGAVVNFTNTTYPGGNLTTTITVVSTTKITGNLTIPYNAPGGKWDVRVTTPDGGMGPAKTGAFSVKDWSKPSISSINQTKGTHGTTIGYAITGTNFQPGSTVNFTNSTAAGLNFTAGVSTVTLTKITGSVTIPADRRGKYGIEVLCPDGKIASKANAFTIT